MKKFKEGDAVVRLERVKDVMWNNAFIQSHFQPSSVCTVISVGDASIMVRDGDGDRVEDANVHKWDAAYFRLATDSEIKQGYRLPTEDHLAEKEAHVECVRNLLEEEKQKVANLLKVNNEVQEKLEAVTDQRDAAVLATKSLGEDLRVARANGRLFRLHQSLLKGLVNGLDAALGDVDVAELGNQLDQIAQMLEQQDNYADAKLLFNAASACEVVSELLDIVDNLRDREPDIYPTIEALD